MKDVMAEHMARYPENFTGETIEIPDPTPKERAATDAIMTELETLAAPLVKWVRETYGPYTEVRIAWDRVDVEQHVMGIPFPYLEK